MSALTSSFVSIQNHKTHFLTGSSLKPVNHRLLNVAPSKLMAGKRALVVRAGGKESAGVFVGGFLLGGIVVGALGCVYAPEISKALSETEDDRKDLMRKLPKFIYDEEKAIEKTRKKLAAKIEQLNSAIDNVSSNLHTDDVSSELHTDDVSSELHTDNIPNTAWLC